MICCDEQRIMQVLIGLQSNAIKFTEKGKVETVVEIFNLNSSEKFLKIKVFDTGIGIPKKDQHRLFKLFGYVQDNKQMNVNGIGLGLAISSKIVEKFDGCI
jgi:signal transduction histidine kinase